jgi:hypothetical protein
VRIRTLFTALAIGCSPGSPPPSAPRVVPIVTDAPEEPVPIDAAPPRRGAACTDDAACGGLACLATPGGYCASACGTGCDGACVATARTGELCLARCTADRDCRTAEGYVCDPAWQACMVPNFGAVVPRACREPPGFARDPAFAPSTMLGAGAQPSAVLSEDGGVVAAFTTTDAIAIARIDLAGRVVLGELPATRTRRADPWLARDARGTLYAVWLAADAARAEIVLARSTDAGATWSAPVAVHEPGDCSPPARDCVGRPMLVLGPDPARRGAQVMYLLYAAQGLRVRASRDGGATFGPASTALAGSYGNAQVGFDGRLHVVAITGGPLGGYGSADQRIEYAVSRDGGATFTRPIAISIRDEIVPYFFANPSLALDGRRGWLYLAYTRGGRDGQWDLVIAATKDRGKTWKRTRIGDEPACAIHFEPNLALDPTTGKLHVAWYDSRGNRYGHAVCPPGAASCTELGRINDAPFAVLSAARSGASWLGDHQSLVVDERRRTVHAVWTQPVAEGDLIRTRVLHAAAKLPAR